uniref:Dachshund homolog 1-like n=1 Tax=Phallusia mammillata TaxID=59560 RepID=A0A6F9DAN1_9ASCI|nr:dachshund homolog 1-like [Phallusia mammillata]
MLVMPTGAPMQAKWDSPTMTSPQLPPYKMERPAYSTPPPVENTPANNECRTVDLRGRQVASFCLNREEYICLPQAFDLFLKNLVGGLHTVYTKLKRLSIHPVVCNVEQVRILRGLGAIQPGVNRCKLITRKDFEILYQDCTTASRPGRPPKRYPMLPPTADLMSHHARNSAVTNSLISQHDFSNYNKRPRMDHSAFDNTTHNDRRASGSPVKDDDKNHSSVPVLPGELHNNATANLAYLQAIRHQYQQAAASGLHNGLDPQQINPALAPFMMMSHPALFPSGIPPTSMAVLNHINQIAQSHAAGGAISNAAVAAAQLVAGGNAFHNANNQQDSGQTHSARENDKDSDSEEMHTQNKCFNNAILSNGMGSDGRTSPSSSVGSVQENRTGDMSDGSGGHPYGSRGSPKNPLGQKVIANNNGGGVNDNARQLGNKTSECDFTNADDETGLQTAANMSSMQNLLTNIQGLLKVAADNANLQEKHASYEIADLKLKLNQERQLRESAEQKLEDLGRAKADSESDLHHQRKENKRLQAKLVSMQRMLGHDVNSVENVEASQPSPRSLLSSPRIAHENQPDSSMTPTSDSSPVSSYPTATSYDGSVFSARISAVQTNANQRSTPSPQNDLTVSSNASNANNSNNYGSDDQSSPEYSRHSIMPEVRAPDLAIDLGIGRQERSEHLALQDARHYFKNSLLYQPSASQ